MYEWNVSFVAFFPLTSDGVVIEVDNASVGVEHHVLQNGTKADSVVDVWLVDLAQVDALGVATALNVGHAIITPSVLVVTNEVAVGISGQGGLASA